MSADPTFIAQHDMKCICVNNLGSVTTFDTALLCCTAHCALKVLCSACKKDACHMTYMVCK